MDRIELIRDLFLRRGDSEYGGESVTQMSHALQAATLAEVASSPPALIVAALLHDVGHLLHDLPDDSPDRGLDDRHEVSGFRFLKRHFEADVVRPVRLHVDAKRYLCTVDPEYLASLSRPSVVSFHLQGGEMNREELEAFRADPHFESAVELRRWDDLAKVNDWLTPDLDHFLGYIDRVGTPAE